jgi:outer membrane protein assembly factor BamA
MSLNIIYNWVVKTISQQNYCWSWICLWEFDEMPFIKQFFNGGTNSRAFRARSIGPGSYDGTSTTNSFLADQSGDLKLEFSTEYRAKIYDIVKGPYLSMPETSGC